jgi:hypothetical protein
MEHFKPTLSRPILEDARVDHEAGHELMTAIRQPRAIVGRAYAREPRPYTVSESTAKLFLQPGGFMLASQQTGSEQVLGPPSITGSV